MSAKTALQDMKDGKFVRKDATHRTKIVEPELNRYHLYISMACPWANGCLAALKMKGLEDVIGWSNTHPTWQKTRPHDENDGHSGWCFRKAGDAPLTNGNGQGSFPCDELCGDGDPVNNAGSIRDLYELAKSDEGKYTTPVLWDKKTDSIVNNESTEILRIFDSQFQELCKNPEFILHPPELEEASKLLNDSTIYERINNGVYRCGFARTQSAYEEAFEELFDALDEVDERLGKQRYLCGDKLCWLDLRLFMTLIRFDEVYVVYFKTNKKLIREYHNLYNYMIDVFQTKGIGEVISMSQIKTHYFTSHLLLNPFSVIPRGRNDIDYASLHHDREKF